MKLSPSPKPRSRWLLWLPLLAMSAWLAWKQPGVQTPDDGAVVQARVPSPPPGALSQPSLKRVETAPTEPATEWPMLVPRSDLYPSSQQAPFKNLFASVDWTPPTPPPPLVKPPAPVAPPLPFTFIGKGRANGEWQVFLGRGDEVLIVQEGQTLANQYRIESVAPPLMTITYLPLGQTQTLAIGESQ